MSTLPTHALSMRMWETQVSTRVDHRNVARRPYLFRLSLSGGDHALSVLERYGFEPDGHEYLLVVCPMPIGSTDGLGLSRLSSTSCRCFGRAYPYRLALAENVDELLPALQGSLPSRSRGSNTSGTSTTPAPAPPCTRCRPMSAAGNLTARSEPRTATRFHHPAPGRTACGSRSDRSRCGTSAYRSSR